MQWTPFKLAAALRCINEQNKEFTKCTLIFVLEICSKCHIRLVIHGCSQIHILIISAAWKFDLVKCVLSIIKCTRRTKSFPDRNLYKEINKTASRFFICLQVLSKLVSMRIEWSRKQNKSRSGSLFGSVIGCLKGTECLRMSRRKIHFRIQEMDSISRL